MKDIRFSGNLEFGISNLGFVSVVRNANFVFPYSSGKPTCSFIFVNRGRLKYNFINSNNTIVLEKDDVLFIPKNYPYVTTYLDDNTKIQILNFDFRGEVPTEFSQPIFKRVPEITLIFNSFSFENTSKPLFLASKIYELLYHVESQMITTPNKYLKLLPAIKELQGFYFKNEKISYYANLCGMSEPNFRKLFKEYLGKSPIEYRNLIRMSNVKRLSASGEFKMNEIAYLVGFNNMAFFYEVYNKYKNDAN